MAQFYPKVLAVEVMSDYILRVTFADGSVKRYDCAPLLEQPAFRLLRDRAFFRAVHADRHGYGVVWNDDLDLAESELWLHGVAEETALPSPSETPRPQFGRA